MDGQYHLIGIHGGKVVPKNEKNIKNNFEIQHPWDLKDFIEPLCINR